MTTFIPRRITAKASKAGNTYWEVETDSGKATAFDYAIVQELEKNIGKSISLYDIETNEKGFSNIRKHNGNAKPSQEQAVNKVLQEAGVNPSIEEARKQKDISIYTSYAKDIFIALQGKTENDMAVAVQLVKLARDSFTEIAPSETEA